MMQMGSLARGMVNNIGTKMLVKGVSFEAWHYCPGRELRAVNGGDYGGTRGRSRQYLVGHVD